MAEPLEMSLDDVIKLNKKSTRSQQQGNGNAASRGRGHGRTRPGGGFDFGSGPGGPAPPRRFNNRGRTRMTPYFVPQAVQVPGLAIGARSDSEAGTKLYISNLDYEVSNEDIKVLFSEVGDLKRYSIHYDRSGRSKGTAEVVFLRHSDALAAIKRYNNIQLDGKPMKIELVGMKIVAPPLMAPTTSGVVGSLSDAFRGQGKIVGRGSADGAGGRGLGKGRARGSGRGEKMSSEDLDADLEKYRLEAMRIN